MFECSRCTARTLRALLQDAPAHIRRAGQGALRRPPPFQRRHASSLLRAKDINDNEDVPFDKETQTLATSPIPQRHLELELKWLTDKVKLAEHVKHMVQKNNEFDKALALVRQASKSEAHGNVVVAWNHLLKYTLDRGETEKAFSVYNDMKKRAQFPDSHTYLIMLKGFGITKNTLRRPSKKDISRVLSIYNSMRAPNSKVKPAVIHSNAALQACSLVQDMDSAWAILAQMDEEGANASDYITYTVILNAIRISALKNIEGNTSIEEVRRLKLEAAQQGREIWVDVVKKWRSGKIQMDDRLVIAMAQLLLFSPSLRDWDDVLNLMAQTMDIPRVLEPLGSKNRATGHVPLQDEYKGVDTPLKDAFEPLRLDKTVTTAKKNRVVDTFKYARPGPGILAIMLEACFVMRTPKAALELWVLLTQKPFNVRPDLANVEAFLRICSVNRSSATAARILEETLERFKIEPRAATIFMAMQACARNNQNKDCVQHAAKIVDVMNKYFATSDASILTQYLSLATHTRDAQIIRDTVEHLAAPLSKLKASVDLNADLQPIAEIAVFAQALVGAIDTAKGIADVPEASSKDWSDRREDITRFITALSTKQRDHTDYPAESMGFRPPRHARRDRPRDSPVGYRKAPVRSHGQHSKHDSSPRVRAGDTARKHNFEGNTAFKERRGGPKPSRSKYTGSDLSLKKRATFANSPAELTVG